MSATTEMTLSDKIRQYLEARQNVQFLQFQVQEEGKAWRDSLGRFTIKSRLRFQKQDGLIYTKGWKSVMTEEAAMKSLLYGYLRQQGVFACQRCGGAGGAKHWPGFTCYDCNGTCVDNSINIEEELNRALDGEEFGADYIAKRSEKIAAMKAEQERLEAEARVRDEELRVRWITDNAGLVDRARKCYAFLGLGSGSPWARELENFITRADRISTPQGAAMFSAPLTYEVEQICNKVEARMIENERVSDISKHVGVRGERQEFTARVTFTKTFTNEFGESNLTVLADDEGNVLKYWNTIKLPDPQPEDPKNKRAAEKGERVTFCAMVAEHDNYRGVNQTGLQRVTKARLA